MERSQLCSSREMGDSGWYDVGFVGRGRSNITSNFSSMALPSDASRGGISRMAVTDEDARFNEESLRASKRWRGHRVSAHRIVHAIGTHTCTRLRIS